MTMASRMERRLSFVLVFGALVILQAIFSMLYQHGSLRKLQSPSEWLASPETSATPFQRKASQLKAFQSINSTEVHHPDQNDDMAAKEGDLTSKSWRSKRVSLRLGGDARKALPMQPAREK